MGIPPVNSFQIEPELQKPPFADKVFLALKNGKYWMGIALYFGQAALFYGGTLLIGKVSLYIGAAAIVTTFIMRSIWWTKTTPPTSPSLDIAQGGVPDVNGYFSQQDELRQQQLKTFISYERAEIPITEEQTNISVTVSSDDSLSYAESLHKKAVLIVPANANSPGNSYEEYLRRHTTLKKAIETVPKNGKNYENPLNKDRVYIFPHVAVIGVVRDNTETKRNSPILLFILNICRKYHLMLLFNTIQKTYS